MSTYTITEFDVLTGVQITREMTPEEIAEHEAMFLNLSDSTDLDNEE